MIRNFKGIWIPAALWLDQRFSVMEKILLVEIDSFDNNFGCVASNKTLGEKLVLNHKTISGLIKSLEEKSAINLSYSDMNSFQGRSIRVLYPPLLNSRPPSEFQEPLSQNQEGGLEIGIHSNTFSNTSSNNSESKDSGAVAEPDPVEAKKERKKPAKKESKFAGVFTPAKEFFLEYYQNVKKEEYYFEAKDAKALTGILEKVLFKMKAAKPDDEFTDNQKIDGFRFFIHRSFQVGDQWTKDNFSLTNLNSKANDLFAKIKANPNGTSTSKNNPRSTANSRFRR
jgi:hypothetical protein